MNPATLVGKGVRQLYSSESGIKIPCLSAKGLVFTAWIPSPEELEDIAKGQAIWLIQHGPYIPPMTMRVGDEKDVIPHDVRLRAIEEAHPDNPHEQAVKKHQDELRQSQVTDQDKLFGRIMLAILAFVLIYGGIALWRFLGT
jgi:hypothetical protein